MSLVKELIDNFYRYILPLVRQIEGFISNSLNPYNQLAYEELGGKIYEAEVKNIIHSDGLLQENLLTELILIRNLLDGNSSLWEHLTLNEIGDASAKTYKWEESDDTQYEYAAIFTTDSETRYEVGFDILDGVEFEGKTWKLLESTFAATPKGDRTDSVHVVVNKGEVFKVMATITQITKHFVKELNAGGIVYTPSLKKGEQYAGSQRDKLYQAFIKKAYPSAQIEKEGTSMIVLLPKQVSEGDPFGLKAYAYELARLAEDETEEQTIDFDIVNVNGGKAVIAHMDGQRIGALALTPYKDGYKVKTIMVKKEYRRFGIGTNLYLLANEELGTIYSDDYQTADAGAVWDKMVSKGIAKKLAKNSYIIQKKSRLSEEDFVYSTNKDKKVMDEMYTIYLDMDGVIADFDKQFREMFGMPPGEFKDSFGVEKFWDRITQKGVGFWRGIDWMPGGQELYNYVAQHKHYLLSAPSQDESSRIGKRLWRRDKTPNTRLILASAKNKPNYADATNILIDDRKDTIDAWNAAGGIGILYTSAEQAIGELKKLGL